MTAHKILAVASGGGHWVQLRRLLPALEKHNLTYATTNRGYAQEAEPFRFYVVNDASRDRKLALIVLAMRMAYVLLRERPDIVISTGAAPGYVALRLGRFFGARTIWVDSIANVDAMSLAGTLARPYADLWLTQWPHLAAPDGPGFAGGRVVIFLTVGTQLPFDRLVRALDEWAGRAGRTDVVAQTGPTQYAPRHLRHQAFVAPSEFARLTSEAELVVSHAGMGTILSALGTGTPILVMPRLASLGEHRNDHQLATARRLQELGRIRVAMNETELAALLDVTDTVSGGKRIGPYASDQLLARLQRFIEE